MLLWQWNISLHGWYKSQSVPNYTLYTIILKTHAYSLYNAYLIHGSFIKWHNIVLKSQSQNLPNRERRCSLPHTNSFSNPPALVNHSDPYGHILYKQIIQPWITHCCSELRLNSPLSRSTFLADSISCWHDQQQMNKGAHLCDTDTHTWR